MAYTKRKKTSKPAKKMTQREEDDRGLKWAERRLFGTASLVKGGRVAAGYAARKAAKHLQENVVPRVAEMGAQKIDDILTQAGAQVTGTMLKHTQKLMNPTSDASQGVGGDDPAKVWLGESKPTSVTPQMEQGFIYRKEFIVRSNMESNIFRKNKELYARTKHMYFDFYNKELSAFRASGVLGYFNWPQLYSQSGYNRRGWYGPTSTFIPTGSNGMINSPLLPLNTFLTGSLQRWAFVREHLCTAATDTYMQDQAAYSDNNLRDLSFLLSKSIDTTTVFSRNPDVGINVTAHVLRCRKSTSLNPHLMLSDFNISDPNFLKLPNKYVYDRSSQGAGNRSLPVLDRGVGFATAPTFPETCTVPGVSYSLSPTLKEHWEVVDVFKQKLMPNDKWEIKTIQEYSDVFSYRAMQSLNPYVVDSNPILNTYTGNLFNTGDLALLFTFMGDPANGVYTDSASTPYNQSWLHAPSRISIVSNSSIEYHCQEEFDPDTGARTTALQQSLIREAEDADQLYSANFGDADHTIMVASNLEYRERTVKTETT